MSNPSSEEAVLNMSIAEAHKQIAKRLFTELAHCEGLEAEPDYAKGVVGKLRELANALETDPKKVKGVTLVAAVEYQPEDSEKTGIDITFCMAGSSCFVAGSMLTVEEPGEQALEKVKPFLLGRAILETADTSKVN